MVYSLSSRRSLALILAALCIALAAIVLPGGEFAQLVGEDGDIHRFARQIFEVLVCQFRACLQRQGGETGWPATEGYGLHVADEFELRLVQRGNPLCQDRVEQRKIFRCDGCWRRDREARCSATARM